MIIDLSCMKIMNKYKKKNTIIVQHYSYIVPHFQVRVRVRVISIHHLRSFKTAQHTYLHIHLRSFNTAQHTYLHIHLHSFKTAQHTYLHIHLHSFKTAQYGQVFRCFVFLSDTSAQSRPRVVF